MDYLLSVHNSLSLSQSLRHTHPQTNKHTQTTFLNWKFLVLFSSSLVRSIFILNQPPTPNPRSGVNTLHYTAAFATYYTHISVDKQMEQVYPVTELQACLKFKQNWMMCNFLRSKARCKFHLLLKLWTTMILLCYYIYTVLTNPLLIQSRTNVVTWKENINWIISHPPVGN